jgi:hypothetical protein
VNVTAGRLGAARRGRAPRILGLAAGAGLVVGVGLLVFLLTRPSSAPAPKVEAAASPVRVLSPPAFETATGVRITQVTVTGGGGIVDLRYQVLDPDKAGAVHSPESPPLMIDERNGVTASELVMNHAHRGVLKAGVTYYLLFYNPGNLVLRGDSVTVQLGEARQAHVPVR